MFYRVHHGGVQRVALIVVRPLCKRILISLFRAISSNDSITVRSGGIDAVKEETRITRCVISMRTFNEHSEERSRSMSILMAPRG